MRLRRFKPSTFHCFYEKFIEYYVNDKHRQLISRHFTRSDLSSQRVKCKECGNKVSSHCLTTIMKSYYFYMIGKLIKLKVLAI